MAHSKDPPSLPKVVDEAGDTPSWVPALGLALFALLALLFAARYATSDDPKAKSAPSEEKAAPANGAP
ncbi:MAG: hypothetical protein ABW321_10325 [Polyangiales bacterium]